MSPDTDSARNQGILRSHFFSDWRYWLAGTRPGLHARGADVLQYPHRQLGGVPGFGRDFGVSGTQRDGRDHWPSAAWCAARCATAWVPSTPCAWPWWWNSLAGLVMC